ncbi:MAG: anthranilate phosphoribosyltransferase [Chloroflexota bacterium]|jgi:anthranilate phosphoribosyltransferase|nr:anthranilate phosphoribosyltransferase [Chloroflexota bacterium]
MGIRDALAKIVEGEDLSEQEAAEAMQDIATGTATPAQIGAFAVALRMKGETVDEMAGLARVMRAAALRVAVDEPVLDTCGTGGDGAGTFNISTTAAIVACAAGARIAKHGNRAASSLTGSADILGALGVVFDLPPEAAAECIRETGIGFLFAPAYHPALASVAGPRREMGVRTVFNVLGPLANPAWAQHQLLGVPTPQIAPKMAEVLKRLGTVHTMVVHGQGLDEVTLTGTTEVDEVVGGEVRHWTIDPREHGYQLIALEALKGGDAAYNAELARKVLAGERSPYRDVVELNAGAALLAADKAPSLGEGIAKAREAIDSGAAARKLAQVVEVSQRLKQNLVPA